MSTQANAKITTTPRSAEPELITRAKAGDRDAFGTLYNEYRETVYRFVYYRVGSRVIAEDLTSETFLRAMHRINTFTWMGRSFGAWLVTIARNIVTDHFKASRTRFEVTTAEHYEADEAESTEDTVLREMDAQDAVARLSTAMAGLTDAQQKCIRLRYLEDLSTEAVAALMEKRPEAIKTLAWRGMQSMKRVLASSEVAAA
ncbi:sigma-70 family RNA polymerase sigma factor [Streptomyces fagopyri]